VTVDPRQLWRAIERRGLGGAAALALGLNHAQPAAAAAPQAAHR
jgi:hypothetical protein